ncbi:hypothetical protein [Pseudomonas sp. H3_C08]
MKGVFETLVPGVVTGSDRRRFSKVQKRWPIAKIFFDRMDKALGRELWRDEAVRAEFSDPENTLILNWNTIFVGVSLLAIAVYQTTKMSTENPPSRAGSLPQF